MRIRQERVARPGRRTLAIMPLPITDTRHFFRPLCREIVDLLDALTAEDWERPAIAGAWRVRDVVAHLLDTALRRLSFHRDRSLPSASMRPTTTDRELVTFIHDLNATWIRAAERLSTRVLTDLYARASMDLADFVETLDLHATALFPVSWAGEAESVQWLDIGREFTEVWHHGSQIRQAVGAGQFSDPRWLQAVLQIAVHALPYVFRDLPARQGLSVSIRITGRAPGGWTLQPATERGASTKVLRQRQPRSPRCRTRSRGACSSTRCRRPRLRPRYRSKAMSTSRAGCCTRAR
jgi:uncharacterized protein (TIGR03083 family)